MDGSTATVVGAIITVVGSLVAAIWTITTKRKTDTYDQVQEDLKAERENRELLTKRIDALEERARQSDARERTLVEENQKLRYELTDTKYKLDAAERRIQILESDRGS